MNKKYVILLMVFGTFLFGCSKTDVIELNGHTEEDAGFYSYQNGDIIPGKYIVRLAESVIPDHKFKTDMNYEQRSEVVRNVSEAILKEVSNEDLRIERAYNKAIIGFVASLSSEAVNNLKNDPRVISIEQDRVIILAPPPGKGPGGGGGGTAGQVTPWGISRVNGGGTYSGNGVAWIIDTGIDLDHPDLNVDASRGASFLSGKSAGVMNDENGHGTHVAGTVAAIDNEIGVIGVAPGATVIPVRVLDRRGSGTWSGVLAGIDFVATYAQQGDVANMSLGGGVSTTIDAAVVTASQTCTFCLAAGNESDDADNHSPARAEVPTGVNGTIYTISAMEINDIWASYSNYGTHVDYCEPGSSIKSCWKDGGYNTISGTSMATPHMAGLVLIGFTTDGRRVNGDPDSPDDLIALH